MKKIWDTLINDIAPYVLGGLWTFIILAISAGVAIWCLKWIGRLVGVVV